MTRITHPQIISTYDQGTNVSDFIFPVARAQKRRTGVISHFDYQSLIGTAFFIGNRGYALTAGHVIDQLLKDFKPDSEALVARFRDHTTVHHFEIIEYERHPSEDIGLIRVNGTGWQAQVMLSMVHENSSCQYNSWGYPLLIAQELQHIQQGATEEPDLIFTEGYVRRNINRPLRGAFFAGTRFYEINEIAGGGYSGAPIIAKNLIRPGEPWPVFGIYVGENTRVGYAVRLDEFLDWSPTILGTTISSEANT